MLRLLAALLAFSVVAGCATQAQIEAIRIAGLARDSLDKVKTCLSPIYANPQYARIYDKLGVAMSTDDLNRMPSKAQLTNPERIPDDDIALGLRWYAETQECLPPAIEAFWAIDPEAAQTMISDSQREITDLINEIVTSKPTYGYVNQRLFSLKLHSKEVATQWAQTPSHSTCRETSAGDAG